MVATTEPTPPPNASATSAPTIVDGINCDTMDYIQRYSPVALAQIVQFVLAYTTVSVIVGARIVQQPAYFHPNVKALLKAYHAAVFIYGAALGTAQIYHILTSLSYENCELLIACRLCFGFRLIITGCVIMFCLLLLALPIERTIATRDVGKGYENRKGSLGRVLAVLVTTVSFSASTWYHWDDLSGRTCTHCVYDKRVLLPQRLMVALSMITALSLVYTILLLIFNRLKLAAKTYSLAIEFQINQNLRVLHLLLPISAVTCFAFCWFTSLPYFTTILNSSDPEVHQFHQMVRDIFPVYTLLAAILWLSMMYFERKKKRIGLMPLDIRRDEKDVYFQTLNDQWSRAPSHKQSRIQILNVFSVPRTSITLPRASITS